MDLSGRAVGTSMLAEAATPKQPPAAIQLAGVIKVYREADLEGVALRGIDLEVAEGEFVAIIGRSGSGKSTLLNLVAGSDRPTAGRVVIEGTDIAHVDDGFRERLRRGTLGIVFQSQNLVPSLDLVENVLLAAALAGRTLTREAARDVLTEVGLGDRIRHRPNRLSGGEQQRAALACVAAARPRILLADEITGELDSANATLVLDLLRSMHSAVLQTVLLVTHNPEVAARADRVVELRDGRVVGDRRAA